MATEGTNTIKPTELLKDLRDLVIADRDITELTEKLAAARGVKSGIFKRNEGRGGNKEALKLLLKFRKLEDDERAELLDTVAQYAGWAEIPLWTPPSVERPQGALFDPPDPQVSMAQQNLQDARVDADASNTARTGGEASDNPHQPGTRDHQTWATAFADAKAGRPPRMIVVDTAGHATTASTARRPRAAKGGNGAAEAAGGAVQAAAAAGGKRGRKAASGTAAPPSDIDATRRATEAEEADRVPPEGAEAGATE